MNLPQQIDHLKILISKIRLQLSLFIMGEENKNDLKIARESIGKTIKSLEDTNNIDAYDKLSALLDLDGVKVKWITTPDDRVRNILK